MLCFFSADQEMEMVTQEGVMVDLDHVFVACKKQEAATLFTLFAPTAKDPVVISIYLFNLEKTQVQWWIKGFSLIEYPYRQNLHQ